MDTLYERSETFASGQWLGVRVSRAWGNIDGGLTVSVGKGFEGEGGSWEPLPVPVYDRADAEMIARDLFVALLDHARREAHLFDQRANA